MILYNSKYLIVEKRGPILVQKWTGAKLNTKIFKSEMLEFQKVFEREKPQSVLWNHENFDFEVPDKLYAWIDKNIIQKQINGGIINTAFTVSKDAMAHISVTESMQNNPQPLQPKYFLFEHEAEKYLLEDLEKKSQITSSEKNNNPLISLDLAFDDLSLTKEAIENLKQEQFFASENKTKFDSLTQRERDVFKLIALGNSNKETAKILFIETTTVATHRKRIIKKLELKSSYDWFLFAKAFRMI